ncbi:MAG: hypothetical protein IIA88_00575 [Bacteroidetes bacterium]|nr:hypothetical protein [Bacteroidota bacterium]
MKELRIRDQLIDYIRILSPELLSQAYHYLELLKSNDNKQTGNWKNYIGCISDKDAQEQKELIDREFENIEGEW